MTTNTPTPLTDGWKFKAGIQHIDSEVVTVELARQLETKLTLSEASAAAMWVALPKADNQGLLLGKNFWISWDTLAGWHGDDEAAREEFYKTRITAKGVLAYRELLLEALSSTAGAELLSRLEKAENELESLKSCRKEMEDLNYDGPGFTHEIAAKTRLERIRDLKQQLTAANQRADESEKNNTSILQTALKSVNAYRQQRDTLAAKVKELEKDKERLNKLRELMGYVECGESTTVKLYQDDATKDFFVTVGQYGKESYYSTSFRGAIDQAIVEQKEKGTQE